MGAAGRYKVAWGSDELRTIDDILANLFPDADGSGGVHTDQHHLNRVCMLTAVGWSNRRMLVNLRAPFAVVCFCFVMLGV